MAQGQRLGVSSKSMGQAIAWAQGKLSTAELGRKWRLSGNQVTQIVYRAGIALREAVKAGLLK